MTFRQLVYRNILRNPRTYLSYFLSSVFSVAVFFTAALLYFHPLLESEFLEGNTRLTPLTLYFSSTSLFGFSLLIIASLSLVFLGSMFRMFLRERRHGFSLYLILGMTKRKLKLMIAWENTIICGGSIIIGISLGLIFSKLMLLVGQNILSLDFILGIYWPQKAIIVTTLVYLGIFSVVTLLTAQFVQSKQANMKLSVTKKLFEESQVNHYLTALGCLLIPLSYACFFILAQLIRWQLENYQMVFEYQFLGGVTLIGLILLIAGMFLCFNQSLVHLVKTIRAQPFSLGKNKLLLLSNLVYRLKDNGSFNFMIALASTIALIIVTSTLFVAKLEIYGSDQKSSLAYTYRAYNVRDLKDVTFHDQNIEYMTKIIKKAGYLVRVTQFDEELTLPLKSHQLIREFTHGENFASSATSILTGENKLLSLIPLSEYNEMAAFNKAPKLTLESNYELVLLSGSPGLSHRFYTGDVEYPAENEDKVQRVTFRFSEGTYQAGRSLLNATVISDAFYATIKAAEQKAQPRLARELAKSNAENTDGETDYSQWEAENLIAYPFYIIHFREWSEAPKVDHQIRDYLRERQESINEEVIASDEEYDPLADTYTFFDYSSSYQTLSQQEEETGTSLLVSILVGTVFFIFSGCLIYFRLFASFENDCQYHRTLDLIGIPKKQRHQLLAAEIWALFFLPMSLAWLNYLVFGLFVQGVFQVNIWLTMLKVLGVFGSIHLLSYMFARKHYLESVDYRLEHIKNY